MVVGAGINERLLTTLAEDGSVANVTTLVLSELVLETAVVGAAVLYAKTFCHEHVLLLLFCMCFGKLRIYDSQCQI